MSHNGGNKWPAMLRDIEREILASAYGLYMVETDGHAKVVAAAMRAFGDDARTRFYVETLAPAGRVPRPDLIVVDPRLGCVVIECKGVTLDRVVKVEGQTLHLRRSKGMTREDPFAQADKVMFRLKDLLESRLRRGRPIFSRTAALPLIEREAFEAAHRVRWPRETLFADDFATPDRLRASLLSLATEQRDRSRRRTSWSINGGDELDRILRGRTTIVAARPNRLEETGVGREDDGRLGVAIERQSLGDALPTQQQHEIAGRDLSGRHWLFRGVAGSGKSVMLAMNAARHLFDLTRQSGDLFNPTPQTPRVLVTCYNKTLVPFLRSRIEDHFRRLAYDDPPIGSVDVTHIHGVVSSLARVEPSLQPKTSIHQRQKRASEVVAAWDALPADRKDSLRYDAVFVDESQDFEPADFELLKRMARANAATNMGTLAVFYDNAQNIYGAKTPVWRELGIEIVGRTEFLDSCHRNTAEVLDLAFNVLVGSRAAEGERAVTRQFADVRNLAERKLIEERGNLFRTKFSHRGKGLPPRLRLYKSREHETDGVATRVHHLTHSEGVLPSDILILFKTLERHPRLPDAVREAAGPNVQVRVVDKKNNRNKDLPLIEPDTLTMSTVHSGKGYDAAVVILVGVDQFDTTTEGRALFYVGATRARHALILTASEAEPRKGPKRSLLGEVYATAKDLGFTDDATAAV